MSFMKTNLFWVMVAGATASASVAMLVACGSEEVAPDLVAPAADASAEGSTTGDGGASSGDGSTSGGPRPAGEGGVTADGGIDPPEAGPGGDTTKIACGATTCPLPAEICCVSEVTGAGDTAFACVAAATCPQPAGGGDTAALKCSGAANCAAGTVCCVRDVNGNAASECKASCGNNEAQLCDPKAASTGCPAADPCSSKDIRDWGKLPSTFATCGGQGN